MLIEDFYAVLLKLRALLYTPSVRDTRIKIIRFEKSKFIPEVSLSFH